MTARPIAAIAIGQLLAWGSLYYALPVFAAPISADLGWDRALVFWGLSAALLASVAAAPLVGRLVDQGHGKAILIGGQLIGLASLLLIATASDRWVFLLLCCGVGVAQAACLYDVAFSILHRLLREDAPKAIVRVTLVAGFAGTLFVPLSQYLVDQVGWRLALFTVAAIGATPAAVYAALMPSEGAAPAEDNESAAALTPMRWNGATISLVAAFGVSAAVFSTVTIHFVSLMVDRGMGGLAAAQVFALFGPSQVAARIAMWPMADRLSPLGHGGAVFLLQAASVGALALAGTGPMLIAFALLFGASSGLLTILRGTAVAKICCREAIGRLNGAIGAASGLSRALCPALFALVAARWSANAALILLLLISLAGTAAFILAGRYAREA